MLSPRPIPNLNRWLFISNHIFGRHSFRPTTSFGFLYLTGSAALPLQLPQVSPCAEVWTRGQNPGHAGWSDQTAPDVPRHFHFNRNFFALGTGRLRIHFAENIKRQGELGDFYRCVTTLDCGSTERMMGQEIRGEIYVDRGYRGHDYEGPARVLIAKIKRKQEPDLRRWYRKRNGIEAAISHMKNDGWLGRNYLKGMIGSRINALLSACRQNLRKFIAWLAAHPGKPFCALLLLLLKPLHKPFVPVPNPA